MTRLPRDLSLATSPGSGLPWLVREADHTIAAFASKGDRADYLLLVAQCRHAIVSIDRHERPAP